MLDFFIEHKVFFIVVSAALIAYYSIFFAVYGKNRKKNKSSLNNKKFIKKSSDYKKFIKLAPELDDIPVVDDEVTPSGAKPETDWEQALDNITEASDKLKHQNGLNDLLSDSGIETED